MNTMANFSINNSQANCVFQDSPSCLLFQIFMSIIAAFGIFSNALVFIVISKFPNMRNVPNYLTASLVLSNWFVCTTAVPFGVLLSEAPDVCRKIACGVPLGISIFLTMVSLWSQCPIVWDRYFIIKLPTVYPRKRSARGAVAAIAVTWLIPALLATPYIAINPDTPSHEHAPAQLHYHPVGPGFYLFCLIVGIGLPILALVLANVAILVEVMRRRKKKIRSLPAALSSKVPARASLAGTSLTALPVLHPIPKKAQSEPASCRGGRKITVSRVNRALICAPTLGEHSSAHDQRPSRVVPRYPLLESTKGRKHGPNLHLKLALPLRHGMKPGTGAPHCRRASAPSTRPSHQGSTISRQAKRRAACISVIHAHGLGTGQGRQVPQAFWFRRERKTFLVTFVILGITVGLMLPMFLFESYVSVGPGTPLLGHMQVSRMLWWLSWCNSAVNPIVYTVFKKDFQVHFKKLFHCT
ncbi:D(2) dopamine receptor-like [Acanthaster planci]|uniref:D(2) dopamine receptor-like n=1 Tax=Acanthaster planci TaxID=133434 RepID=A0A8B7ZYU1_ACAPL|nr:D(2) dopamine receptor-like [Acanthaster planci]